MPLSHEHIESKILAEIKIYIHTRAELICPLCYEIPCISMEWLCHNKSTMKSMQNWRSQKRNWKSWRKIQRNSNHPLPIKVLLLVTQPMMQRWPNQTELRSMDSYIQILCRFQKSKQKVPPPSHLSNEK